jgi:hypothetical protein
MSPHLELWNREGTAMRARADGVVGRRIGAIGLGLALLALGAATPARAGEEIPEAAGWVAADALAYLEVVRPEALLDRATSPEIRELIAAVPGLEEQLQNQQLRELKSVADVLAAQLGVELEPALRDLTADGLILAVEGEKKVERVVLIVDPRDADLLRRAHEKLVTLARADAQAKGKPDPVKESSYRDIPVFSVSEQEAHAIVEDRLVIANGTDALKSIIDRAQQGESASSIADDPTWRARREAIGHDAVAFAFAKLDRLRAIDPEAYGGEKPDAGATFLLGAWYQALRESEWASATFTWTGERLAAELTLPTPPSGFSDAFARFRPEAGQGADPLIQVPGTLLSVSLWRDFAAIWEVRQEIFPPEAQQNLAQLDSFAGTFFGGRDFGSGVLGSLDRHYRLVIANQDYESMDPAPDVKLPGFALLVGLKLDDEEFVIGLVNLGAAQQKAPPLLLGSETVGDVTIATASFVPPKAADEGKAAPIDTRYNFSPSSAQVGDTFILGSSLGLTRKLVEALQSSNSTEPDPADATLLAEADGDALARLVTLNRERLAMNTMLEKGSSRTAAEAEMDLLARLLRYLHHGRLTVEDRPEGVRLSIEFQLSGK